MSRKRKSLSVTPVTSGKQNAAQQALSKPRRPVKLPVRQAQAPQTALTPNLQLLKGVTK